MQRLIKTLALVMMLLPAPARAEPESGTTGRIEAYIDGVEVGFPLLKTDIRAKVAGDLATVTLEQTFANPHGKPLHAKYLFPLNHDAAVNAMVMEVGDERIQAKIQKKEEAQKTFEKAKSEGKAASLLVQHRPNMFTQDIANLMPGMPVKVTLTYVHALPRVDAQYELVLPLVAGPRYQPEGAGKPPMPAQEVSSTEKFGKWELEQLPDYPAVSGLTTPHAIDARVSIEVDIEGGMPVTLVGSTTHKIVEEQVSPERRIIRLAEGRTVDNADFVLRYSLSGSAPQAGLLAHKDKRGGFFSLQLEPPAIPQQQDIAAREMVFVLDTSGSMDGEPINASKLFMKHALNGLRAQDYFRIIRFSNNATEFISGPVPATRENVARGLDYVNSMTADGGTEAMEGITKAFSVAQQPDTLRLVVLLTDGYIGNEASVLEETAAKMGDARIYAFGVGTSVNRYLLEEMGRVGRGFARFVDPTEKSDDAAIQLVSKLETPVLTDISVNWGDLKPDDVVPQKIPDLFTGGGIRIQGKYARGGKHTITVNGKVNGRKASMPVTIELPEASGNDGSPIPTVWARAQIGEAMRLINTPNHLRTAPVSDDSLKQRVTALGLDFSLMTKWTSFVAVSEKIVNKETQQTAQRDVPLPMVKGVTPKAYGSSAPQMASSESFSGGSVPEPAEWAGMLVLALMAGMAFFRRHRERILLRGAIFALSLHIWFVKCRLRINGLVHAR